MDFYRHDRTINSVQRGTRGAPDPHITRALLLLLVMLAGCGGGETGTPEPRRILVLGIDGMDYSYTRQLMEAGEMPHFTALARQGLFKPLETTFPPLSPVAWSDFIVGRDAGHHGIFDFLHRSTKTLQPVFSMANAGEPEYILKLGNWRLPLSESDNRNLRLGEPFWATLTGAGVDTSILRMPANYPPSGVANRELSGMGTPDLLGSYGTFTYITSDLTYPQHTPDSGRILKVRETEGQATVDIDGPINPLRTPGTASPMNLKLTLSRGDNPQELQFAIDDKQFYLAEGEWSYWVPVAFQPLPGLLSPLMQVRGMVRFYLRRASPWFEIYMSPINLDPHAQGSGISAPDSFAGELASATGRFYTQGMPEDTKAFEAAILSQREFLEQAHHAREDTLAQLPAMVEQLRAKDRGFLFYYLGYLDQISHMLWGRRPLAEQPPEEYPQTVLQSAYREIDTLVGDLHQQLGNDIDLVVMSDHGFAAWEREFDLNAWLEREGYLVLRQGFSDNNEMLAAVDWSKTRAYGVGFNGLYINLQSREASGIVDRQEYADLVDELAAKLLALHDPKSGEPAITRVARNAEFSKGAGSARAPDLVLGYRKGTRVSSKSALGGIGQCCFSEHTGGWSGDHAMDPMAVPGILLTSFQLRQPVTRLRDLSGALQVEILGPSDEK